MPTALVVDDNRQSADLLCRMISLLGVPAQPAYGPRAALLALKEKVEEKTPIDILFLDINMPGINGFEILAFFRREPLLQDLPVVIVTSDDQPQTAERARRAGAQSVIIKPASLEAIEQVLVEADLV
jgi:CheY-like chemotaxis protein